MRCCGAFYSHFANARIRFTLHAISASKQVARAAASQPGRQLPSHVNRYLLPSAASCPFSPPAAAPPPPSDVSSLNDSMCNTLLSTCITSSFESVLLIFTVLTHVHLIMHTPLPRPTLLHPSTLLRPAAPHSSCCCSCVSSRVQLCVHIKPFIPLLPAPLAAILPCPLPPCSYFSPACLPACLSLPFPLTPCAFGLSLC